MLRHRPAIRSSINTKFARSRYGAGYHTQPSATLSTSDARGLLRLGEKCQTPSYRGILLYGGEEVMPFGKDTWAVPLSGLWAGLS